MIQTFADRPDGARPFTLMARRFRNVCFSTPPLDTLCIRNQTVDEPLVEMQAQEEACDDGGVHYFVTFGLLALGIAQTARIQTPRIPSVVAQMIVGSFGVNFVAFGIWSLPRNHHNKLSCASRWKTCMRFEC